ncbi:hypothetical protein DOY81_012871, partial [Sarcophaga bullata]
NEQHQYKNFIPNMKHWREFLYFLCIWNAQCFAEDETKAINARFETQLELIKQQMTKNHDAQLRQQKELFENLERKLHDLSLKIEGIQEKLFDTIKFNTENLKDFIRTESQHKFQLLHQQSMIKS